MISWGVPKRWLRLLLPTPLLLALGAWASAHVADRAGAAAAVALSVLAPLAKPSPSTEEPDAFEQDAVIPTEQLIVAEPVAAPPPVKGKKRGKALPASGPPVVFVSKAAVLGLASTGARPHGVPVTASGVRPPGLRLSGVAALGVGLRDGDVLTRALGQPALSSGAVIRAVLVARAHHAAVLEGEFWRGNQRFLLRVEQPYLLERRAEADEPDANDAPRAIVSAVARPATRL